MGRLQRRTLAEWILGGWLLASTPLLGAATTEPPKPDVATDKAAPAATDAKAGEATTAPDAAAAQPASTAPPAPIRNPPLRLEIRRNQPLAKQIEGMEGAEGLPVWLGEEKDPFLGLYIESYVGETLGAVLLLHDNEQHPDWPGMLRELRISFPKNGWSTMSIALPDFRPIPPILPPLPKPEPVAAQAPAADAGNSKTDDAEKAGDAKPDGDADKDKPKDQGKNEKEPDSKDKKNNDDKKDADKKGSKDDAKKDEKSTEDGKPADADTAAQTTIPATPPQPEYLQRDAEIPVDKYPEEIERRIKTATRYLINEGAQHVVIVAFGSNAGLATHISRKMLMNELDGLVLMDPKPYPEARFDLPKDTADLRIPVLDVVPEFEPGTNPLLRKQATGRMQTPQYEMRLVRGAAVNFSGYEPYVFKAVRGWADTQFRNAPKRKDRKVQAEKKRVEKAAPPITPTTPAPASPEPKAPAAPPVPKGKVPTPNLNEPIPPPIPG